MKLLSEGILYKHVAAVLSGVGARLFTGRSGITATSISQWEKRGKVTIGMQSRTLTKLVKAWSQTHGSSFARSTY